MSLNFLDINPAKPTGESIARDYAALNAALDRGDRKTALADWDRQSREYSTWSAHVGLRISQNVTDAAAKADNEHARDLGPKRAEHSLALTRRFLADPDRKGLEKLAGKHALDLWQVGLTTFDPAIANGIKQEDDLIDEYRSLIALGKVELDGKTLSLGQLSPFAQSLDRDTRHRAETARWNFYGDNSEQLDDIYDRQVKVRQDMAKTLGDETYTPLAYRLNSRIGYDADDVARFRDEVAADIVPLVGRILEKRKRQAGWDRVHYWDEALTDLQGNPKPVGGLGPLMSGASTMFHAMDSRLGTGFDEMIAGGFYDLERREGKANSAFCTTFPSVGRSFIFGNLNGTYQDLDLVVHEFGHRVQNEASAGQPMVEYLQPSNEAGEIPSKGLEFLSYPHIANVLEPGAAERYRRMHLTNSLTSLPYVLCVDHFQHDVYANPSASPADRNEMWRMREQQYMPWRDYGDLEYPAKGGRWQAQRHIYNSPFYYIDYAMAECCVLQLWSKSRQDYAGTMDTYFDLCRRGGEAPFQELIKGAGLVSPFEPGVLKDVLREAEIELGLGSDHGAIGPRGRNVAKPKVPL